MSIKVWEDGEKEVAVLGCLMLANTAQRKCVRKVVEVSVGSRRYNESLKRRLLKLPKVFLTFAVSVSWQMSQCAECQLA